MGRIEKEQNRPLVGDIDDCLYRDNFGKKYE